MTNAKRKMQKKVRALYLTIIILLIALFVALGFLFAPKNNGDSGKAYRYDLDCLTGLHKNPLIECREESEQYE